MSKIGQIISHINEHPLATRHRCRAYFNFFGWQLSQAFYPHERKMAFVHGTKLVIKKGMNGATGNIYMGLHDFNDMGFLLHFLRADDLFFDIGANVGTYSVLAAGCSKSRVCAFEPVLSTFLSLRKNVSVNKLQTLVKTYNIGIGGENRVLKFTISHDAVNHVVVQVSTKSNMPMADVEVESFDNIVSLEGNPLLVKIDVEGFETEVIAGMKNSLKSDEIKVVIIELNGSGLKYGYHDENIHATLTGQGFHPYEYNPLSRELKSLDNFGTLNTIYLRDLEFVKNRIANAEKIKIFSESF